MSTTVSAAGRGCQPSIFVAFAVEIGFGSPKVATKGSSLGTKRAAARINQSGASRFGTRLAPSPSRDRRMRANSGRVSGWPAAARKRSPAARGLPSPSHAGPPRRARRRQPGDLPAQPLGMPGEQRVLVGGARLSAVHVREVGAHVLNGHAGAAQTAHALDGRDQVRWVSAVAAGLVTRYRVDQPDAFVVAQRRLGQPDAFVVAQRRTRPAAPPAGSSGRRRRARSG